MCREARLPPALDKPVRQGFKAPRVRKIRDTIRCRHISRIRRAEAPARPGFPRDVPGCGLERHTRGPPAESLCKKRPSRFPVPGRSRRPAAGHRSSCCAAMRSWTRRSWRPLRTGSALSLTPATAAAPWLRTSPPIRQRQRPNILVESAAACRPAWRSQRRQPWDPPIGKRCAKGKPPMP